MGSRVEIEFDVLATMRDGVRLRADVYRPVGTGPWPVLLMRTPYGKDVVAETLCNGLDPAAAARLGFLVVVQDTRGRFASEGDWAPLRHERHDGFDTVEWAARLPGSDGRVGLYGASYCGHTQWMAAIERPPSLAAISPLFTWSEPTDGLLSRGGATELGLAVVWSLQTGLDWVGRRGGGEGAVEARIAALVDEWDALGRVGLWRLPAGDVDAVRRHGVPGLDSFAASTDPAVAARSRVAGHQARVTVPSLHTGGWYDVFLQGTLDNYEAMAARGGEARLVVGPWSHEAFQDPIGERLFGLRAARDGLPVRRPSGDWKSLQLEWFRHHLRGERPPLPERPVRIFVMGREEWREEAAWPLARARRERWFLHADGSLAPTSPGADAGVSEFLYDPGDPVPTVGGQTLLGPGHGSGPVDQAPVESRADVLVFTSAPLPADLEVTGRVRATLHVGSSAPSTDWVVRLCDVDAAGRSTNVCDGILRVDDAASVDRVEVDLWSTSIVFLRAHRIRVQVTSSCFPRWDRNLNTGRQREPHWALARQRLHHDASRPSFVELPVVP